MRVSFLKGRHQLARSLSSIILPSVNFGSQGDELPCLNPPHLRVVDPSEQHGVRSKDAPRAFWRRLIRGFMRVLKLSLLSLPITMGSTVHYLIGSTRLKEWLWSYTIWAIEQAGPTFVKFAQWAANRNDLFPEDWTTRLRVLQDETTPHAYEHTNRCLTKELGEGYHNLLKLDPLVIGSGCIAQVYKGQAKQADGTWVHVAVKVLHPDVHQSIEADIDLMRSCVHLLEWAPFVGKYVKWLSLHDAVEDFNILLSKQIDLCIEARNLERLNHCFSDSKQIMVPVPWMSMVTPSVLVETFIEGTQITKYVGTPHAVELAQIGVKAVLEMVFVHNFVHGDLHAGNILVTFDEKNDPDKEKPIMAFLDAGITVELTDGNYKDMVQICTAFLRSDGQSAGRLMCESHGARGEARGLDEFCAGIEGVIRDSHTKEFFEAFSSYFKEVCGLACDHRVRLESSFIAAAMALKVLEGIALQLDSDIDVCGHAIPILFKASWKHGWIGTMAMSGWSKNEYQLQKEDEAQRSYDHELKKFEAEAQAGGRGKNLKAGQGWKVDAGWTGAGDGYEFNKK